MGQNNFLVGDEIDREVKDIWDSLFCPIILHNLHGDYIRISALLSFLVQTENHVRKVNFLRANIEQSKISYMGTY